MDNRNFGIELKALKNVMSRCMEADPQLQKLDGMSCTNALIIGYLAHHESEEVFQRDLEREFGITRSTASKIVTLMVQKGYVTRCPVPQDARLKKLALTEKARVFSENMFAKGKELEERILAGLRKNITETLLKDRG